MGYGDLQGSEGPLGNVRAPSELEIDGDTGDSRKATMNKMVHMCLYTFTYVYTCLYMFIPSIYGNVM